MKQPIFILGAHKSGTSLLRSLLDGHPELFVIPLETHVFQCMSYWVAYHARRTLPSQNTPRETVNAFYSNLEKYNTLQDPTSDANLAGKINLKRFESVFESIPKDLKNLIETYFEGIFVALTGQEISKDVRFVEKSVENTEFALEIYNLFVGTKFLHIIRNPYSNLVSFRKHLSRNKKFPFLNVALGSLQNSYYFLYRNEKLLGNSMLLTKYEDILLDPNKSMREIAEFLHISFNDSLLEPTMLGKPWRGNSSRGLEYSGISTANLDRWRDEITDLEVFYINYLFDFLIDRFGYEKIEPTKSFWRYIKGEGMKNYLLNRLLRYYFTR